MTACPAWTSSTPPRCSTRSMPRSTTVYSSNAGVCPGSTQPDGLRMCATLTAVVPEFTRPTYSSMFLGLLPAATMHVALGIRIGVAMSASFVAERKAVGECQRRVLAAGRGDELDLGRRRPHGRGERDLPRHRGAQLATGDELLRPLELARQRQIDAARPAGHQHDLQVLQLDGLP